MNDKELLTTFMIDQDIFGIGVMEVQEVTNAPFIVSVPMAPPYVKGLINLRGQIATALGLRELFGLKTNSAQNEMSVVCRLDGNLVSLVVDSIGDVIETDNINFEPPPSTLPPNLQNFLKGVYKVDGALINVIDLEKVSIELAPKKDNIELQTEV